MGQWKWTSTLIQKSCVTLGKSLPFSGLSSSARRQYVEYTGTDPQRPFLSPSGSNGLGVQSTSCIVLPSRVSPALGSKAGRARSHPTLQQKTWGPPEPVLGPSNVELSMAAPWWPNAVIAACP